MENHGDKHPFESKIVCQLQKHQSSACPLKEQWVVSETPYGGETSELTNCNKQVLPTISPCKQDVRERFDPMGKRNSLTIALDNNEHVCKTVCE